MDALVDEKNPTIRAYTANLRRQVADVAAKYGVNARDVFRADVQERMEVDDLATVAALVKRIGVFSEKTVDRKEIVELGRDLDRRERKAKEMLEDGLKLLEPNYDPGINAALQMFLRAGLVGDAVDFCFQHSARVEAPLMVKTAIAEAQSMMPNQYEFRVGLLAAMRLAVTLPMRGLERFRAYGEAFGLLLENSQNFSLGGLWEDAKMEAEVVRRYALDRLAIERQRRGLASMDINPIARDRAMRSMLIMNPPLLSQEYDIFLIEEKARCGMDPNDLLRPFLELLPDFVEPPADSSEASRSEIYRWLVQTAAKTGADASMRELVSPTFWTNGVPTDRMLRPYMWAATACAGAGKPEKALEYLRAEGPEWRRNPEPDMQYMSNVDRVANAFLDADDIAGADAVLKEYIAEANIATYRNARNYVAARIRRGDDLLDGVVERALWNSSNLKALDLISGATAAIGFVNGMRKRGDERE